MWSNWRRIAFFNNIINLQFKILPSVTYCRVFKIPYSQMMNGEYFSSVHCASFLNGVIMKCAVMCLQPVSCHSVYNLKLQTSLKRIQDNLIVADLSQLTETDTQQTEGRKHMVRSCSSWCTVVCSELPNFLIYKSLFACNHLTLKMKSGWSFELWGNHSLNSTASHPQNLSSTGVGSQMVHVYWQY